MFNYIHSAILFQCPTIFRPTELWRFPQKIWTSINETYYFGSLVWYESFSQEPLRRSISPHNEQGKHFVTGFEFQTCSRFSEESVPPIYVQCVTIFGAFLNFCKQQIRGWAGTPKIGHNLWDEVFWGDIFNGRSSFGGEGWKVKHPPLNG